MINLWELIKNRAESNPRKTVITDPTGSYTYSELLASCTATATSLKDNKSPVLIIAPSSFYWAVGFFACLASGRPSLCLGSSASAKELNTVIRHSRAEHILYAPECRALAEQIAGESNLTAVPVCKTKRYEIHSLAGPDSADAPACYHLTSGSNGISKMVERRHDDMLIEGEAVAATLCLNESDCLMFATPAYHSFCSGLLIAALYADSEVILLPQLDVDMLFELSLLRNVTVIAGVPYVFSLICHFRNSHENIFTHLRMGLAGGAPLNPLVAESFYDKFHAPICQEYGLSEAGIVSFNLDYPLKFPKSIGKPIKGVNLHISAPGQPEEKLPADHIGQIIVSREASPRRYIDVDCDDVFHPSGLINTGDLGWLDHEGNLFFAGREKLFVNVAGNKVAPREVEEVLNGYPCVMDSFVFPVPNPITGEAVAAVIISESLTGKDIRKLTAWARAQLSSFKVPRYIDIRSEFDRTPTGKPDFKRIQKEFITILEERSEYGFSKEGL